MRRGLGAHLWQVEPLAKQVDADEHRDLARPQLLQHLYAVHRLGARVHVRRAQPVRCQQLGEALVALKIAETSNGMVAEKQGVRSAVTGEDALGDVMIWRRLFPAICVGAGTVACDDPSLTARIEGLAWSPVRIVVDGSLSSFSENLSRRRLYSDEFADRTIVVTSRDEEGKESRLKSAEELGVRLWRTDARKDGRIPPASLRLLLRELSLNGLYCEGGPQLARSILAEGEADYLFRYRAPKVFDGPDALPGPDLSRYPLKDAIEQTLGEDHLNHGFL